LEILRRQDRRRPAQAIPNARMSFIGRRTEMELVSAALSQSRLVTAGPQLVRCEAVAARLDVIERGTCR